MQESACRLAELGCLVLPVPIVQPRHIASAHRPTPHTVDLPITAPPKGPCHFAQISAVSRRIDAKENFVKLLK